MKYKFEFKETSGVDRGCVFYGTNEIEVETPAFHESCNPIVKGRYQYGVNGKNTAFANLTTWHKNHQKRRKIFKKHFRGNNAGLMARAWLNLMLNNLPDYIEREEIT